MSMLPIKLAAGLTACLVIANAAWAQNASSPKPAPTHQPAPMAPKPLKSPEATPTDTQEDPAAADEREQKRLDEKLKSICRGC
jgi:hypothetical protein